MASDTGGTIDHHAAPQEALHYAVSDDQIVWLNDLVTRYGDPLEQRSEFSREAWAGLTDGVVDSDSISRGEVFDIAGGVRRGERPAKDLFTASYAWGQGSNNYGPSSFRRILTGAGDQLEPALRRGLKEVAKGPVAGYESFFGGPNEHRRARPLQESFARIGHFGPSFFSKLIYFAAEDTGGLILDKVLATAVHRVAGMPGLVDSAGNAITWSSYRYAVYLYWMQQTAARLANCPRPHALERALFEEYR